MALMVYVFSNQETFISYLALKLVALKTTPIE